MRLISTTILLAALVLWLQPWRAAAEPAPSCSTDDVHLAALCETYCVHLGCDPVAPDDECAAIAETFRQRSGDALVCVEVP